MIWMLLLIQIVTFQTINVNNTTPCFLNDTAGVDMWRNCGIEQDYLNTITLGFQWITGGYFTMILVSLFIAITYIKYHKAIYPILIGIIFIPLSWQFFPTQFQNNALILTIVVGGICIYHIITHQTKEYSG